MTVLDSTIDRVVMYRRGATVRRRARVALVEGRLPATVSLGGLPLALEDGSVRISLVGDPAGVEIASIEVGLTVRPAADAPEAPDAVEIRRLEREILRRELRSRQLVAELEALVAVPVAEPRPPSFEDRAPPPSPTGGRVALEELLDAGVRERRAAIRALQAELEPLRDDLAALRDRHRRASAGRTARPEEVTRVVRVRLVTAGEPPAEGVELELAYHVAGARWAPAYQVWIDGESARIALRALVTQSTGEDWRGARLSLSTAAPGQWHELPHLSSVRLGRAQPPPLARAGFRPPPTGAEQLLGDFDRDRRRLPATHGAHHAVVGPAVRALTLSDEIMPQEGAFDDDEAYGAADVAQSEMAVTSMPASAPMGRSAPMPPPAAAPAMAKRSKAMAVGGGGPGAREEMARGGGGDDAPALPPARVSFTALVLRDPTTSPTRGHLAPVDRRAAWLEMLADAGREIPFDAAALVDQAVAASAVAATRPLPPDATDVGEASGRFDFVYETDHPVDVPSDAGWHTIPVGERSAECRLHYVVVPREDLSAWRMAALENPLRSPLMPGPAEVYVDGDFVLATTLPPVAPRERFQLGLGVEQAIRVVRNTRFHERRSGSAVVATTELWHELEILLQSRLARTVSCQVRERIPVASRNAEVVIEEGDVSPDWFPYYQDEHGAVIRGGRRWEVQLPPGREIKLEAAYVVKLYVNNQVVGGNRREA